MWLHFHTQLHLIITLQHNTILKIGPLFSGTFRLEPATNWFDESFAPILKSHERFARQQRSRSSITYHVTSTSSRIDHQLSGIKSIILLYENNSKNCIFNNNFTFIMIKCYKTFLSYYTLKLLDSCFKTRQTNE